MLVDGAVKEVEEPLGHRFLDEEPGAGEADLAGVVVLAGGPARCGLEVGVGEHEQRPLPAELGRERDEVLRGRDRDRTARLRRAGERYSADARSGA